MYISCKWGPKGSRTMHLFWGGKMSRLLYWAVPNVPKILVIGQWMWLLLGKSRKYWTRLLFWGGNHVWASLLGSCQCFKNIGDGPINVVPSERKKARVRPFLINRSTNKYPSLCAIVAGLATSWLPPLHHTHSLITMDSDKPSYFLTSTPSSHTHTHLTMVDLLPVVNCWDGEILTLVCVNLTSCKFSFFFFLIPLYSFWINCVLINKFLQRLREINVQDKTKYSPIG
jgi:hypothetical protein